MEKTTLISSHFPGRKAARQDDRPDDAGSASVSLRSCFLIAALLGGIVFLAIYGFGALDVTSVDWIKRYGDDFFQSYWGWEFFRRSAWYFPFGLMDGAQYPNLISIIYIDSVPLFDVFFKLFEPILPANFQFFGIWGLACFSLSGGISSVLIGKRTGSLAYAVIGSVPFILCTFMVQRLFTHTSLAANWLLLLGIAPLLFEDDWRGRPIEVVIWPVLMALAVSISIYYVPMLFLLMFACLIIAGPRKRPAAIIAGTLLASIGAVVLTMYLLGGFSNFSVGDAATSDGYIYGANLDSLLNPMETGQYLSGATGILPSRSLAGEGQYEGYAYLGCGGLALLAICAVAGLVRRARGQRAFPGLEGRRVEVIVLSLLTALFLVIAVGPVVTLGSHVLFEIPYPAPIARFYGIFRSYGRFMWPAWDIILLFSVCEVFSLVPRRPAIVVLLACTMLQIADVYPLLRLKHGAYANDEPYVSTLVSPAWDVLGRECEHVTFMSDHQQNPFDYFVLADRIWSYGLTFNDFYYSRRSTSSIRQYKDEQWSELLAGQVDASSIYVFSSIDEMNLVKSSLSLYEIDGFLVGVSPAEGDLSGYGAVPIDADAEQNLGNEPSNTSTDGNQQASFSCECSPGYYCVSVFYESEAADNLDPTVMADGRPVETVARYSNAGLLHVYAFFSLDEPASDVVVSKAGGPGFFARLERLSN